VSVVIPAYNAARYLGEALDSVFAQTVTDLEVVVVDDGSTDDTPQIAQGYGSRVRYVRQANAGVASARNRGLAESTGRYVAFLDADDTWLPGKLERQVAALAARPAARVCHTDFDLMGGGTAPAGLRRRVKPTAGSLLEQLLTVGNVVGTPSTVVCERSLLEEVGGFDPALSQCADWDLWARLAPRTEFVYVDECLVRYRQHDGNMSRDVRRLENDSVRLLDKAFSSAELPPHLRRRRRAALAWNDTVLSGSYLHQGQLRDAVRCAARSLRGDPRQVATLGAFPVRALGRWFAARRGREATATGAPRVLYLVYWGAGEPLGQSLVLPAVARLATQGARLTLVTFDKRADLARGEEMADIRTRLAGVGVRWVALRYHRRPQIVAKAWDGVQGLTRGFAAGLALRPHVVQARTFVGGLIGAVLATLLRARLVYHSEGFYPDEQADAGVWARGSTRHRLASAMDRWLYAHADALIVLSRRARAAVEASPSSMTTRKPVVVVPSCVDLDRFVPPVVPAPGNELRLVYSGSVGGRYAFETVAAFAAEAIGLFGRGHLRVLTRADRALVEEILSRSGLARGTWSVEAVPYSAVPAELGRAHAGLLFLVPGGSEHAGSPTKVGEYWACGLPVVTSPNAGDTGEIIRCERVGVIAEGQGTSGHRAAAEELRELLRDPGLAERCRHAARTHYSLEEGCRRQMDLYRQLL
jgi:glycosyltransferase involved in cell wall biosynthesis